MSGILIGLSFSCLWVAFEMWRSPLLEETPTGFKTIRPARKLKDIFKSKPKSGTYSDLEKLKRGRSKY